MVDVIGGFTKTVQHSIKNISRNIKAVFFLTWHQDCTSQKKQRSKMTPVMPLTTFIFRFYPKQGSSTHNNLMGRVKTILEPCVCQARPSVPL